MKNTAYITKIIKKKYVNIAKTIKKKYVKDIVKSMKIKHNKR